MIRYQGIDPDWWRATAPGPAGPVTSIAGDKVDHVNTILTFKKREVDTSTPAHIVMSAAGTAILNDAFNANGNEPGQTDLRIDTIAVGGTDPITIAVDQTLP